LMHEGAVGCNACAQADNPPRTVARGGLHDRDSLAKARRKAGRFGSGRPSDVTVGSPPTGVPSDPPAGAAAERAVAQRQGAEKLPQPMARDGTDAACARTRSM
jgi:hypothetical protein